MERYDYETEVQNSCYDKLDDLISRDEFDCYDINVKEYATAEEFIDALKSQMPNILMNEDSVTGVRSGSYYSNGSKAEESLCHNLDILIDVCEERGETDLSILRSPESCDVMIRQHYVPQVTEKAIDQLEEEGKFTDYYNQKIAEQEMEK